MAKPDDTGGGTGEQSRATEYTGPTGVVRNREAATAAAIELDEETTNQVPTPPPGTIRRTIPRAATPNPRSMIALAVGDPVGEYEIESQIGEGAMGTVYLAAHPVIGKQVAIKVLKPELCANQASVDRFVQEAQAVNKIGHPNIVDVFSLGELPDGRAYFVMEYLRGEDLKARLAKGPLSLPETCDVLSGIARALEAAHAKDIVHRDLKPDNVFLHQVGDGAPVVKLLDFGIAKLMRDKLTMEKTQTGNMLGTPRYISPEQARGIDVTPRADIYSLGVMAYEMLANRPLFTGETGMDLVVKHLNEPAPPISQFVKLPRPLEQCVMAMLAKDPAERPDLATIRQVMLAPTDRATITLPRLGKRRTPWIAAAVFGVLAIGSIVAWQALGGDSEAAPPVAAPTKPAPVKTEDPVEPAVVAPARGGIAVTVRNGKGAEIFVDGEDWGTNMASRGVDAGKHVVTAKLKGKPDVSETVVVNADEYKQVTLAFPAPQTIHRAVQRPTRRPAVKRQQPKSDLLKPKGLE